MAPRTPGASFVNAPLPPTTDVEGWPRALRYAARTADGAAAEPWRCPTRTRRGAVRHRFGPPKASPGVWFVYPSLISSPLRFVTPVILLMRNPLPLICLGGLAALLTAPSASVADAPATPAAQALQWRLVGPFRGGRTRAVTGIPGQPETFLIGAVDGGVWKTDDFGRTWAPIFDDQPTQSIGAIAVAPSDPTIYYVATGEGLHRPDLSVGNGVYRSADSGHSWTHVGLDDAQQIPDLAIDAKDPNRVYAAVLGHPYGPSAERGIYRSTDGGQHWTRVLATDPNTGGSSIKIDPSNPRVLYASMWNVRSGPWEDGNVYNGTAGGLYKSTDGGDHWRKLSTGLPQNLSQIEIAVAPSDPRRLYATIATTAPGDYQSSAGLGIYRSDDAGETWKKATTDPRPALRVGGGDLAIVKVDPSNADVLYSATIVAMKSTDGGANWTPLRGAPGGDDYQNLWVSPDNPRHIALVGDQGGIITVNGGRTWSSWFNQSTAQLYHVGITPGFPYGLCSGQQESGSVCISSRGNDGEINFRDWHPVGVIEYGYVAPDPLDADVIYGAGRNVVTKTHRSTGQVQNITPIPLRGADVRVDRTEPILFSPHDPHRLYVAANHLYATTDGGNTWSTISPDLSRDAAAIPASVGDQHLAKAATQRGAIYSVSASPLNAGLLWAGTDDGLIWTTSNEGKDWRNVTPPALTPWSKVTQLEASHFDAAVAYASVSRFRIDDLKPYLYRTRDGGQSWQLITAGLPDDAPANAVREDPARRGLLYAATETAVWVSYDDGDHWASLQLNLPHTSMRDLAVHDNDLIVATHGRAFWILDDLSPIRQSSALQAGREAVLMKPAVAIRVQRSTGTDTPIPPDEPAGRNPPTGAIIDYWLEHAAGSALAIDVIDAAGSVVRHVSSTDAPPFTEEESQRELIPSYWIRKPRAVGADTGMHRWVWDLHYETPRTPQRGYPISAVPYDTPIEPAGPVAPPGEYRVRLSIGKHRWEQPLTVIADPRVHIGMDDYAAQLEVAQRLASVLDQSTEALLSVRSLRAQIKALTTPTGSPIRAQVDAFDKQLGALLDGPAGTPAAHRGLESLNADLATLYGQVTSADAAPTRTQVTVADAAITEWPSVASEWAQLTKQGLAMLNASLRRAHLAQLRPELAPPRDPDQADEE